MFVCQVVVVVLWWLALIFKRKENEQKYSKQTREQQNYISSSLGSCDPVLWGAVTWIGFWRHVI